MEPRGNYGHNKVEKCLQHEGGGPGCPTRMLEIAYSKLEFSSTSIFLGLDASISQPKRVNYLNSF